jgi:transposase
MAKSAELETLPIAELIKLVLEQRAEIGRLKTELEALKRKQARQTAPFSRNTPKTNPKPSGRKVGLGEFKYRDAPKCEAITQTVNVATPEFCPTCDTILTPLKTEFAFITDLPELQPRITEYRISVAICPACQAVVRGTHADVANDQRGASAHRLHPNVIALGQALQYGYGIPNRRVPKVLQACTGITVTSSALCQSALSHGADAGGVVQLEYQALRRAVRHEAIVHTDDTGWRVNAMTAFVMTFKTNSSVVYQIRSQHRSIEVNEVIPSDFKGIMVTDRFSSYDAKAFNLVKQQKCVAHILKNIRELLEPKARGRSHEFLKALRGVFRKALRLQQRFRARDMTEVAYRTKVRGFERQLTQLLEKSIVHAGNMRLQHELRWHHERGSLLRFLHDPRVEATNNVAERALRPVVIHRKLSAGSKNARGAEAFSAFKSVIETGLLLGVSPVASLLRLYRPTR